MRRGLFLSICLALGACASHEPPMATGPWRQMNVGKWSFHENALTTPPTAPAR